MTYLENKIFYRFIYLVSYTGIISGYTQTKVTKAKNIVRNENSRPIN